MAFPGGTKSDVKGPRMYMLTLADFVFQQLETSIRSTASWNDLNLFFLIGLWKGIGLW